MINRTVLISGAGIAGPTLAYWLKAAGFEPVLIEVASALRTGGYVVDFWGLGYDIAEHMGLRDGIDRVGYHVREVRIVNDQGKRVAGFGVDVFRELTHGRFVTLGRSELSRLIFEKIDGKIETIFDDEIISLEERGDHVLVQFKRGNERTFDLVVGADGLHSQVRRLAFGPQHQFERKLGYTVAAFEVNGYRPRDDDIYTMYGEPGRMLGRFPMRDNKTLFLFIFATRDDVMPDTLDHQRDAIKSEYRACKWEYPHISEELDLTKEIYFDRVSQIRMQRWSRGRIALVGDAAFCVSLLAGQGTALAMTSAYVLAGELANASGGYDVGFESYELFLRDFIAKKQRGAERFGGVFAPKTRLGLWFRNQVMNTFAIPGLATFAIGRDIIDTLQLPRYRW